MRWEKRRVPQREPYGYELLDELRKSKNGSTSRESLVADQLYRWIGSVIHEAACIGQLIYQLHLYGDGEYTCLYHVYDQLCRGRGITITPPQGDDMVLVVRLATKLLDQAMGDAFCTREASDARECYQTAHVLTGFVFEQTELLARTTTVQPFTSSVRHFAPPVAETDTHQPAPGP